MGIPRCIRMGGALLNELNLNSFEGTRHTGGAGLLAVLGPGHPADVGGVDAVVDVVALREGTVSLRRTASTARPWPVVPPSEAEGVSQPCQPMPETWASIWTEEPSE